ncbi:MAG: hypothetical protein VX293_06120 [Candidatus Latescibacterota bacterium]|nr:hypothetical protein [Candidatus Latescibacterota bacterium]
MADRAGVARDRELAGKVVIIDGLTGNGKTMVAPIVGSLDRLELMRFNYHLENIVELAHMGAVSNDVVASLIRTWTDIDLYRSIIGRESNFRYRDLSGAFHNSQVLKYLRRLIGPGDEEAMGMIERQRPILLLVTHMIAVGFHHLHAALGERLCFIELVRHPLYLIKQTRTYMPHFERDPRVFHQLFNRGERQLQWWTWGWEDLYLRSNPMDQAIYMINWYFRWMDENLTRFDDVAQERLMLLPFERFVLDPEPYMTALESFIGTTAGTRTARELRKQNVPRGMYAEGIALKIYKRFGWEMPDRGASEDDELAKRRAFAADEATEEAMKCLDQLCRDYERLYLAS